VRVVGIDPGSRKTGWGVVERRGNSYVALGHGTVTASAKLDLPHRIHGIVQRIDEVLAHYTPDCVAVEEAFYHESVRSTLVLGHVRGALLVAAISRGIEVAEYTPRAVKLSVAGTGAAAKEQVEFMVRRLLGIRTPLQPDASDALAVAMCHLHRERRLAPARAVAAATHGLEALLAKRARR
jgi:crossover junction endodeoxyribonuclease RuvC